MFIDDFEFKKANPKVLIGNEFVQYDGLGLDTKKYKKIKYNCLKCNKEVIIGIYNYTNALCGACKSKKVFLEKYGVDNPSKNKTIAQNREEKRKHTCLIKYGVENPLSLPSIQEKIMQTNIERYGSVRAISNEIIKEKMYSTNMKKYGAKVPSQNSQIKENNIQEIKKRYGENWASERPAATSKKEKMIESIFDGDRISDIQPLFSKEEYLGFKKNYLWKCLKCNSKFEANLMYGNNPRCPICYPLLSGKSQMEKEIGEYIKSFDIKIIENSRSIISPKELDIFIPSHNLAIEFDGLYWHSEQANDKYNILEKTILCENKGIRLIHIFEDEWLYKKEIVKSRLKNILGENSNRIGARKCSIKQIDSKTKNKFLNAYHIQGEDKSQICLGAFYNEKLISVMTFSSPRICMNGKKEEHVYELCRFASISDTYTPGMASKLLAFFEKKYNPKEIYSFADKRWSQGTLYTSIGFKLDYITKPNYWYVNKQVLKREYRFKYRKNNLKKLFPSIFNDDKTEFEIMDEAGYVRIWDCGNYKFIKRYN